MPANKNDAGPPKKRQRTAPSDDGRDASSTCAMADVEPPKSFCCSITMELMRDPVSTADGHTYERAAIARWFADGHTTSPKTGAALEHKSIIPNIALRHVTEEWAERNNAQHLLVPTAEDREADEAQRRERARSIQLHMQLLVHASGCRKENCPSANCNKMKVSAIQILCDENFAQVLLGGYHCFVSCSHTFFR